MNDTSQHCLRTPEERFDDLPGYPFEPHYLSIDGMRVHYLDEGAQSGDTLLLMHGEPSWSYLYRKMIPLLVDAGFRCIAPDLIGFGRSDKPAKLRDYSYASHVAWMTDFIEQLSLEKLTLVCQDWGSLIGLRLAAEQSERFSRIVLGNGGMPTGHETFPRVFRLWRAFARFSPWFPIGRIVNSGCTSSLSPEIIAAYDAPFPDARYKAGARAFPRLVPTSPDNVASADNVAAWKVYKSWNIPFLTAFSNRDPVTRGGERPWQEQVPGAQGQPHTTIRDAGHFLQEDKPEDFSVAIIDFCRRNPL